MDIVIRATVMFAVLYGLIRLLGKRELSQITPFELLVLIVMGDLIQQGVTHSDSSLTGAVLAVVTFAFWSLALNWMTFRFPSTEKLLEGEPSVLVRGGKLIAHNLHRNRMTLSEIEAEMRLAGIAHLTDVSWAILETDGKISFIRATGGADSRPAPDRSPAAT
jgi:uncharacterized membrane protein YcaP (DUF421 family)